MNTRIYLINMSMSDIIMCITAVPVTPYTAFTGSWTFGKTFCHLLPLLQGSAIYVSSLSLLGIAWDRYKALHVTYRSIHSKVEPSAVLIVILIDLTSVMMMVPYCWNMKVCLICNLSISTNSSFQFQFLVLDDMDICEEDWRGFYRIFFGLMTVILQFCVPFIVSLYVYIHIIYSLKDRTKAKLRSSVHLQRRKNIKATNR